MTKTHGKVWNRYGKIFKMFIANFTFWATPVFSSIMYSCFYTVKHDVGNRNLGFFYGAKRQENVKKLDSACTVVTMCLLLCYFSAVRRFQWQTVYVKCIS